MKNMEGLKNNDVIMKKKKMKRLPRGLRNNNPLNIKYTPQAEPWVGQVGTDGDFCIFQSMELGYRAAFRLLNTYNVKYHIYTVQEIIYRWAPPKDRNNTKDYIRRVCQAAGLSEVTQIVVRSWIADKREEAIRLVWAMAKVELGDGWVKEEDMEVVRRGYEMAMATKK